MIQAYKLAAVSANENEHFFVWVQNALDDKDSGSLYDVLLPSSISVTNFTKAIFANSPVTISDTPIDATVDLVIAGNDVTTGATCSLSNYDGITIIAAAFDENTILATAQAKALTKLNVSQLQNHRTVVGDAA